MTKLTLTSLLLLLPLIFIVLTSAPPTIASEAATKGYSKSIPRFLGKFAYPNRGKPFQYETRYFEQRLDHFSIADLPKFRQRYLISTRHWTGPDRMGPIFLYCGNEGDIEWFAANTGFVWDMAPRFGAMVLFPEHRYYGESMPYGSRDKAYANAASLSYLTAEQALADFAVLVTNLKRNLSAEGCPVVLFGGSYGGMLAAWMRLKYPHIAIGALASSAPILQFEDIVPPETFYDIVSNNFKRESISCFDTIKKSWDVLISEGQKNDGLKQLTKAFRLCRDLKRTEDLYDWLDSAYSFLAMVNYPYPSDFLMPLPGHPIKEVCRKMDSCPEGTSVLERIFEGVSVYYNYTGKVECFQLDDDPHGMDGWNWQACTEMVMPMASSRESSMFPTYDYNYSSFQEECWKDFSVKPRPTWITTEFGGHEFKTTLKVFGSNIIFSNGLLDPWSGGSVLQNISETVVALVTEEGNALIIFHSEQTITVVHPYSSTSIMLDLPSGIHPQAGRTPCNIVLNAVNSKRSLHVNGFGAHHIDLRSSTAEDPDWLVEQRAFEVKLIKGWIEDYHQKRNSVFSI
ncbi:Lysosomal Pro-X carboxypeptidase [Vitis vinifera]|uniref:Lysosomal Pro-X carboxypeptidase n=1 Tax=Vitis vinifera TaxID=29760 RepID=A0A438C3R4_VITVI|nr:Lysosomal Pro-X carboxypeptidase [Vitis vinifera]